MHCWSALGISYGNGVNERRRGPSVKHRPWKWKGRVDSRKLQDGMNKTDDYIRRFGEKQSLGRFQICGVNNGPTHQGTEYRTSCSGAGKLTVKGENQSFGTF